MSLKKILNFRYLYDIIHDAMSDMSARGIVIGRYRLNTLNPAQLLMKILIINWMTQQDEASNAVIIVHTIDKNA